MKDNSSAFNSTIYDSQVNAVLPYYSKYNKQILDLTEVSGKILNIIKKGESYYV